MRIVYIGRKEQKGDNVAGTGLVWASGQIHDVPDEKKAAKLLEHKHVWADADKPYQLAPELHAVPAGIEPRVEVAPTGGEFETPIWEPLKFTVDKDIFARLRAEEIVPVFMSPADADAFGEWKRREAAKAEKKRAAG